MGIFYYVNRLKSVKASMLIEGMVSILIIMMVVIGGGAFVYFGQSRIDVEKNRRTAIEAANSRL